MEAEVLIFVDGSWSPSKEGRKLGMGGVAGVGAVIYSGGGISEIQKGCGVVQSSHHAELLAIMEGLKAARKHKKSRVLLFSDCLSAINMLTGKGKASRKISRLVFKVKKVMEEFKYLSFCHIHKKDKHGGRHPQTRKAYNKAHRLANQARVDRLKFWEGRLTKELQKQQPPEAPTQVSILPNVDPAKEDPFWDFLNSIP